jgi:hypothetical protein
MEKSVPLPLCILSSGVAALVYRCRAFAVPLPLLVAGELVPIPTLPEVSIVTLFTDAVAS